MAPFMHKVVLAMLIAVAAWLTFVFGLHPAGDAFESYAGFRFMAMVGDEHVWAVLTAMIAFAGLWAATTTRSFNRVLATMSMGAGYAFLAIMVVVGKPDGSGTGPYIGYAILSLALAFRDGYINSDRWPV